MNKRQLARIKMNKLKQEKTKALIEQEDKELMDKTVEAKDSKSRLTVFILGGITLANLIATVVNFTILKELSISVETVMQFMMLLFQQ